MEQARLLIKIAKNKEMYDYYKLVINTQKELADLVDNKDGTPGRFINEALLTNSNYSESAKSYWAFIESRLVTGEGIAELVYNWMEYGPQQPMEEVTVIRRYILKYKKTPAYVRSLDPNRIEKKFYITGEIKSEKKYENNDLVSEKTFYISGNKELYIVYKNGLRNGAYHKYYDKLAPDGTSAMLSESGFYHNDKRFGAYYFYYESGHKKSILIYRPETEQLLSTSDFYDKTDKIYQTFLYDENSKLTLIEEFYPSGYKKHMIKFVESDLQNIVAVTYENSYEKQIKSTQNVIGTDLVAVLDQLNMPKVIQPIWSTEKIDKTESVLYSSQIPTSNEVKEVLDYANYLSSNSTDVNKLETVVNWLYKTYDGFSLDTQSLFMLSKSVVELKAEFEPNFFVSDQIDYKELSNSIRKYITFRSKDLDTKGYEADVVFLLPLALEKLADNINARFSKGVKNPRELVTQEECNIFTLVLNLMANDVYKSINADVKTTDDIRVAAKLLALKDLSEILKTRNMFSSDTYFWEYARANYIIDEALVKAEEKGLINKEMRDIYNKDANDLRFRSERLRLSSKAF